MSNCGKRTDCKFCYKQGIKILPVRTSAAWGTQDQLVQVPAMPSNVAQPIQASKLQVSKYTLRAMRRGYIYQFEKRSGLVGMKAYFVTADGFLYEFDSDYPPQQDPAFSCERNGVGGWNASVISVDNVDAVERLWLCFTPDPLTPALLAQYQAKPEAYEKTGHLQGLDAKAWAKNQVEQRDTFKGDSLAVVAEYFAIAQGGPYAGGKVLSELLERQLFGRMAAMLEAEKGRWHGLRQMLTEQKGAIFALHDPIGVAQELNDARNAQLHGLHYWLKRVDHQGRSNEWKLHVAQKTKDAETNINQALTKKELASIDVMEAQTLALPAARAMGKTDAKEIDAMTQERDARVKRLAEQRRAQARARAHTHFNKYLAKINVKMRDAVLKEQDQSLDTVTRLAKPYATQHLQFLNTNVALKTAFERYDQDHVHNGIAFAGQVSEMVVGMGSTTDGENQILQWLKDITVGDRNWLLRGFAFNQAKLKAETSALLAQYQAVPVKGNDVNWGGLEQVAQSAKAVPDLMDKMLDAIEEAQRLKMNSWFESSKVGLLLSSYIPLMQGVFRLANPVAGERQLVQAYMGLMRGWLGRVGRQARVFDLLAEHQKINANRVEGQIKRNVSEVLDSAVRDGKSSDWYKMRMVGLIAGLEIAGNVFKLASGNNKQADARYYAEMTAATLGGTAALIEVVAQGAEIVMEKAGKHTAVGASVVTGGLKLWAGTLAGAAGLVGATFDWADFKDRKDKDKIGVATLYFVKSGVGAFSSLLAIGVGFTFAGEYLERIGKRRGLQTLIRAGVYAKDLAKSGNIFWSRVGFMTWLARASWVILVVQIAIWVFDDDDLEKWCDNSVFRLDQASKGFKEAEAEMKELNDAIEAVI